MGRYTRSEIVESAAEWNSISESEVSRAEEVAKSLSYYAPFLVFDFHEAPEVLRKVCCLNGGDEDWLVIARKEAGWTPNWLEHTDSCYEPDVYLFEGVVIYVGSHA